MSTMDCCLLGILMFVSVAFCSNIRFVRSINASSTPLFAFALVSTWVPPTFCAYSSASFTSTCLFLRSHYEKQNNKMYKTKKINKNNNTACPDPPEYEPAYLVPCDCQYDAIAHHLPELLDPVLHTHERVLICRVVHQECTVCIAIINGSESMELFLSG